MDEINKIWPKWKSVEVIGQGGFGTVYKVKRETYDRVSFGAVKVIKIPTDFKEIDEMTSSGMDEESIKDYYKDIAFRFLDEIKTMEKFKSASHIVNIEDYEIVKNEDVFGWTIYIRMELLTNLNSYMKENHLNQEEVVKLGIHICKALEYCHANNIIHRDIKPGNIFISEFGEYKLGDFGISREVEKTNATLSQKGTKSYMAPEMVKMEKYGRTVDIYALGLTMYEILNHGRMPFLPEYPKPFYSIDRENAMLKRLTGEEFPKAIYANDKLNEIIKKACSFNANDRYQTASAMRKALENVFVNNSDIEILENDLDIEDESTIGQFGSEVIFNQSESNIQNDAFTNNNISHNEENVGECLEKTEGVFGNGIFQKNEDNNENRIVEINQSDDTYKTNTEVKTNINSNNQISENKNYKKVIIPIILVITLIIGLVRCSGISSSEIIVSNVISLSEEQAKHNLEKLGLLVKVEYQSNDEIPTGIVIDQSIKENEVVNENDEITIYVSVGKEKIKVKNVIGLTKEEAVFALENIGLKVEIIYKEIDNEPFNIVLEQNPSKDSTVEKGGIVELVISHGNEPFSVPNVVGKTLSETKKLFESLGLKIDIKYDSNYEKSKNIVLNQKPKAAVVKKGDTVTITVNEGGWSDYVEKLPSHVNEKDYTIEKITKYSYRDKQYTTSSSANLDGWTLYDTTSTWSEYGPWSTWRRLDGSVNNTDTRQVETATGWGYYYYQCSNCGRHMPLYGKCKTSQGGCGGDVPNQFYSIYWALNWSDANLQSWYGTNKSYTTKIGGEVWFKWPEGGTHTVYHYRDRELINTYHYWKWGSWSSYSNTKALESDKKEVRTKLYYRYSKD